MRQGLLIFTQNENAPNAEQAGTSFALPVSGWIKSIQPVFGISGSAPPPGRYYVRVSVLNAPPGSLSSYKNTLAVLWTGYYTFGIGVSLPAYLLEPGLSIVVDVFGGSNSANGDLIQFVVDVEDGVPVGGASLYLQEPGSGPGEILQIHLANTANGTDLTITVPTEVRWRIYGFRGELTTSAVAGARTPRWKPSIPGTGTQFMAYAATYSVSVAASGNQLYGLTSGGMFEGGNTTTGVATQPLPPGPWPATSTIFANTVNFDTTGGTGDYWQLVSIAAEEWAMPTT